MMLIYDGDLQINTSDSESQIPQLQFQNSPWEKRGTCQVSQRRLVCNRACALVLLIGINALTYFAVRAMVIS